MAFWNRKKKRKLEEEALRKEAEERFEQIRKEREEKEKEIKENKEIYHTEVLEPVSKADQKRYVKECCQSIAEVDRQIEKIRDEYQEVTEYLKDIQKIEQISGENKKTLYDSAKNIIHLTKERNQYKNRNLSISDSAIRRFDLYEDSLVDEIKKMQNAEKYQEAIDGDLEKLQQEKEKIKLEQKEIVANQKSLKNMSKGLVVFIVLLFLAFVGIYYTMQVDMTLPYMGTVLLAAVSGTVLVVEAGHNQRDMTLAERKMNKAISLMNRVKIKYVNNTNLLEYSYTKFGVKSAAEFEKLWTEYCKAKEYERKFHENTELLNYYNGELLKILSSYKVKDCDIWFGQVIAIVDSREMVEIRHKLNVQRQKLRDQIAYNEDTKKDFVLAIDKLIKQNPENKEDILKIVAQNKE